MTIAFIRNDFIFFRSKIIVVRGREFLTCFRPSFEHLTFAATPGDVIRISPAPLTVGNDTPFPENSAKKKTKLFCNRFTREAKSLNAITWAIQKGYFEANATCTTRYRIVIKDAIPKPEKPVSLSVIFIFLHW